MNFQHISVNENSIKQTGSRQLFSFFLTKFIYQKKENIYFTCIARSCNKIWHIRSNFLFI